MTQDLFEAFGYITPRSEPLVPGAMVLRGFATPVAASLLVALEPIIERAPFRHMFTPGGLRMSVAMTNCGPLGWVSDRTGYRYSAADPESGLPWPPIPAPFLRLAQEAATQAGFAEFRPDACLINRYTPGTRLSLHQDRNEQDFSAPIVSVSLGLPAVFLFGGPSRTDKCMPVPLMHGDVVVWGGPARLHYHGVRPLKDGDHSVVGSQRINLTFRKAA
jgi:alkylated DNA repair protein (DNA oxidative demethylase)